MSRIPVVDQECCISCEVCTLICPEVFRMEGDEHGDGHEHGDHKSIVYNPTGAAEEKIEAAMDGCPAACIYWQE
jgi:ferredoxin